MTYSKLQDPCTWLEEDRSEDIICEQVFKTEKPFPLVALTLYKTDEGVLISVNKKESARDYWENCSLPLELIPEFTKMIQSIPLTP